MDRHRDGKPAAVPVEAKQAGEIEAKWSWVEPCVWTERMLTALELGVKGGKWFSLIDKVYDRRNLESAFKKVSKNRGSAGVDHQTIAMFADRLEHNLEWISNAVEKGSYEPQSIRRVWIPKPGRRKEQRPLGIPTVRDRVVQTALRNVIEPIFEKDFAEHSYGFRPGRGCKDALRRVDGLLKQKHTWIVDADLRSYFDTIPKDRLMERVGEKVSDGRVLELITSYLNQAVLDTMQGWVPDRGTPQGAVISPLLSNIYLDPLDHLMTQRGFAMTRYADDFVVQCRTENEARRALGEIEKWVKETGLTLHPEKTRIVDATQPGGFDFLGYHFERDYRWPSDKSTKRLKDVVRRKTKRTNGNSLTVIIEDLNPVLRGWFEYYKHSHWNVFPGVDGWVRMRIRSILKKRQKRKGRAKGNDNQRWPNAFFAEQRLFSLTTAHAAACQSSRR
jgi:RNA-directed DNA polymerase